MEHQTKEEYMHRPEAMLNNNVQTAARDIRVQTHIIITTILHHHNLAKIYMSGYKGTHQQSVEHKISPFHTVKEAPLSSSERLSIIVAALGALKKQQHPFNVFNVFNV